MNRSLRSAYLELNDFTTSGSNEKSAIFFANTYSLWNSGVYFVAFKAKSFFASDSTTLNNPSVN